MHNQRAFGRADLHIHPSGSGGDPGLPTAIYAAIRASGLQVAVLSDHDRIGIARDLVSRSRDEGIPTELVVGEEISTSEGHLLGIGLSARVPSGLPLAESVAMVHGQGGVAVVAHPLLPTSISASRRLLVELAEGDPDRRPDALEAMHPTAMWLPGWRRRVEQLADRCGYAVVGGSDAHSARSVGRVRTTFPGSTEADLVAAIRGRETGTEGQAHSLRDIFRGHRRRQSNEDPGPQG
jgi:predicted metal-dependent phosphoesterase TrpH